MDKQQGKFPPRYKPSSLRAPERPERRLVTFAVGYRGSGSGSVWFAHGSYSSCAEALDVVPGEASDLAEGVIVRFNADHTDDVIYRWDVGPEEWVRVATD